MILEKVSDKLLIQQYLAGKESALEILILRHKEKVFSYIYSIVKNGQVANDVFQDTFVKVVKTLRDGRYNEEGKFIQWTMRIAHNLSIDHFRYAKRMPTTSGSKDFDIFDVIGLEDENMEDKLIDAQIKVDVKRLVDHLPEEQKQVLKMRFFCEMSFKEIAEETGVSINTALGRMRYALINLRKMAKDRNLQLTSK